MSERIPNVSLEGAEILPGKFKNFSGRPGQYNPAGKITFCIRLDRKTADDMVEDGWNVKQLDPRDEDGEPTPYITARIRFDNFPPVIYMLTGRHNKKTRLDEDTIGSLDSMRIEWADITLTPYSWEMKTKDGISNGITAYVKTAYFKVADEDDFADKYLDDDYPDEVPFN